MTHDPDAELGRTPAGFYRGAVVMLDALGFKGIWNRAGLRQLLEALRSLETATRKGAEDLASAIAGLRPRIAVRFLSDTVVCTVSHAIPFSEEGADGGEGAGPPMLRVGPFSVEVAIGFAAVAQSRAACLGVPLALRGCIGFGDFMVDRNFLVGPAIDEVAEHHQRAEGAVVWLLPSAEAQLDLAGGGLDGRGLPPEALLRGVPSPLKSGGGERLSIVNPLAVPGVPDFVESLLATFGDPPASEEIRRKCENTRAFLERAGRAVRGEDTGGGEDPGEP
ncbi:MAG: hypothetical protein M5U13_15635 [Thermoanaerobaculia bacterium]|nr:hypothetical protein [Thermoanaerobaculia bacterium]